MTKLHFVKKARKTKRGTPVKRGLPYYWFQFSRCPKQYSLTKPKRSAYATRSEYLRTLMDLEDEFNDVLKEASSGQATLDETKASLEEMANEVAELRNDTADKLENVRDAFPNGSPTADLLEDRVEQCQTLKDELEAAASGIEDDATEDDVASALEQVGWDYA